MYPDGQVYVEENGIYRSRLLYPLVPVVHDLQYGSRSGQVL